MSDDAGRPSAVEWLATAAPDPGTCRWEWERNPLGVTLLPAGRLWDVLILPSELGRPTLEILSRCTQQVGPVLADFGDCRMGFFVPPGTAAGWIATGVRAVGTGSWVVVPHRCVPPQASGGWSRPTVRARSQILCCWSCPCTRRP